MSTQWPNKGLIDAMNLGVEVFPPSPDLCESHTYVIVSTPDFCVAVNIARHAYNGSVLLIVYNNNNGSRCLNFPGSARWRHNLPRTHLYLRYSLGGVPGTRFV